MFVRPNSGERVLLVQISVQPFEEEIEESAEFKDLAVSAGAELVDHHIVRRHHFEANYLIGRGKVAEFKELIAHEAINLVIFNQTLSPAQERNLERVWQCRVLDRTGLILDIFAARARSFEGKLQVELAQLNHLSTRLIRGWTHLERQKGGIGLRGPGEKQLELDRRLLQDRIKSIHKRLNKVRQQRRQSRRARVRASLKTVSLVGYTNAGKSTLFNRLTAASVYVEDKLFATLDPTLRKLFLPQGGQVILADTVGFIRHLPDNLIEAFRATLEEITQSDLIIHVIDATDPTKHDKILAVTSVLKAIAADHIKQIEVFNKVDLLPETKTKVVHLAEKRVRVWLSAEKALGFDELLDVITQQLYGDPIECTVSLLPSNAKLRAKLYEICAVNKERCDEKGEWKLDLKIAQKDYQDLLISQYLSQPE